MHHSPQTRGFIRSDECLTLEKSALLSLHGGNLTLINQILVFHFLTYAAPQFLSKLTLHLLEGSWFSSRNEIRFRFTSYQNKM